MIEVIKPCRDELEKQFVNEALLKADRNAEERKGFTGEFFNTCREAEDNWYKQIRTMKGYNATLTFSARASLIHVKNSFFYLFAM